MSHNHIDNTKIPTFPDGSEYEVVNLPNHKNNKLGNGAYASVKLVRKKNLDEFYALKEIDLKNLCEDDIINIRREIKGHQNISHPSIIKFYQYIQKGTNVYILLEYAKNGDLFKYLSKKKRLSESEACKYIIQTANALNYIHKLGIIHRDVKPEN